MIIGHFCFAYPFLAMDISACVMNVPEQDCMALQFASDDLRADREVILRATCFKDHFVSATSTFSNTFLGV